ncbi:ATP synthase subunit I [Candidatus Vallotiella sp. (ex Adelges kitamiensis)]|uniref:ATP synthase subunit I n=1 Tax=Candidatus Vallotiella sp. (ex Adelges kitamiensis) TaxID=2864217 RepID=UPI001CE2D1F2|nr:ATP synthase subunit I [Candidatus Vallotia sp. (ex Adelges kitamiensis)]
MPKLPCKSLQTNNKSISLTKIASNHIFDSRLGITSCIRLTKVIIVQIVVSLVAALAWWLFEEKSLGNATLSSVFGIVVCWVPNALFIALLKKKKDAGSAFAWMLGEVVKLISTIALFISIALLYPNIYWPALLVTYLVTLKTTYWLAIARC